MEVMVHRAHSWSLCKPCPWPWVCRAREEHSHPSQPTAGTCRPPRKALEVREDGAVGMLLALGSSGTEDSVPPLCGGNGWTYLLLILFLSLHQKGDGSLPSRNSDRVRPLCGYGSLTNKTLVVEQEKNERQVCQFAYFPTAKTVSPTVILCLA